MKGWQEWIGIHPASLFGLAVFSQARATRGLPCQGARNCTSRWNQDGRDGGRTGCFPAEVAERNWAMVSLTIARSYSASKVHERR